MKPTKRLTMIMKAVVVLTLTAAFTQASVIYNFVGTGGATGSGSSFPAETVGFQLTNFVNPPLIVPPNPTVFVSFTCAQLYSSINCNTSASQPQVNFSNQSILGMFSAVLGFSASNSVVYNFFIPTGAFGTPGVDQSGG